MDVALSKFGARALRVFFALVVVFLYAPIVILLIFSFNNSEVPSFPLSGFTLHWYHDFIVNADLRAALETSAIIAALSSVGAVALGIVASIALVRRQFRGKAAGLRAAAEPARDPVRRVRDLAAPALPQLGIPRSILTVVIGHIVISLPYAILVLMPRLQQIDLSLEEAALRPRGRPAANVPLDHAAADPAGRVVGYLIAFTTSFDEYAVASFVVGTRVTFPIYLYSALRFPNQLPQVIAVAVVVITISLFVVVAAEIGRRIAERRLGTLDRLEAMARRVVEHGRVLRLPGEHDARPSSSGVSGSSARRWLTTRPAGVSTWNCVYMPR